MASLVLAGCGGSPTSTEGQVGGSFPGVVVADEPVAAAAASDILSAGGSATDAAVALYFALAVTYPSAASLGGGGTCLVHDSARRQTMQLSFLAPAAAPVAGALRPTAVPMNARGMAALHARYGELDWRQLLGPAESMARFGAPVSRASARVYAASGSRLAVQWESQRVFAASGRIPVEGQVLSQPDLAETLARIRLEGAGALHDGSLTEGLVGGVRAIGGSLSADDLRTAVPEWTTPLASAMGNDVMHTAVTPGGEGLVAAAMWRMLREGRRYRRAGLDERPHLIAEAAGRAFTVRSAWVASGRGDAQPLLADDAIDEAMADYSPSATSGGDAVMAVSSSGSGDSTGFVVVDALGGAVACGFTGYGAFGTGAVAPGTGILVAPAPVSEATASMIPGPMMVTNENIGSFKFAAAATDGAAGAIAMTQVAAAALLAGESLDAAMTMPRVHSEGGPHMQVETAASADTVAALTARGHGIASVDALGRVNAAFCPPGLPTKPEDVMCRAAADPRGDGIALYPR